VTPDFIVGFAAGFAGGWFALAMIVQVFARNSRPDTPQPLGVELTLWRRWFGVEK
jgi:hypothetical protein